MEYSSISWTDHTFNPWVGCRHVSPECDHCYADFLVSKRMGKDFTQPWRTKTWRDPFKWNAKAPEMENHLGRRVRVFCASLTDFFLKEADEWRGEAWELIRQNLNLDFLILTKRPSLIEKRLPADWGSGYPYLSRRVVSEQAQRRVLQGSQPLRRKGVLCQPHEARCRWVRVLDEKPRTVHGQSSDCP